EVGAPDGEEGLGRGVADLGVAIEEARREGLDMPRFLAKLRGDAEARGAGGLRPRLRLANVAAREAPGRPQRKVPREDEEPRRLLAGHREEELFEELGPSFSQAGPLEKGPQRVLVVD